MALLECPLCPFSVLPSDDYVLQLHFEQEHTEDSPFRIENDTEPLPRLPARPSSHRKKDVDDNAASDSEDGSSVLCPEPDCGELVLLSDFNEHLDLHSAATLSFDETTGKYQYHSQQTVDMHASKHNTTSMGTSNEPSFLVSDTKGSKGRTPTPYRISSIIMNVLLTSPTLQQSRRRRSPRPGATLSAAARRVPCPEASPPSTRFQGPRMSRHRATRPV